MHRLTLPSTSARMVRVLDTTCEKMRGKGRLKREEAKTFNEELLAADVFEKTRFY